jgi:hypothetical protein
LVLLKTSSSLGFGSFLLYFLLNTYKGLTMTIPAIRFSSENPLRDAHVALTHDLYSSGATGKEFRLLRDERLYSHKDELISLIGDLNKQDFCELMNAPYDLTRADSYNNLPDEDVSYETNALLMDNLIYLLVCGKGVDKFEYISFWNYLFYEDGMAKNGIQDWEEKVNAARELNIVFRDTGDGNIFTLHWVENDDS